MNERIKEIREFFNMSRATFGEHLGISGDVVNNLERGRVNITDDRVKLICSVFDVREEWLRHGEKPMMEKSEEFSKICREIGVNDPKAKEAIIKYYELSSNDKELWWKFVEKFMK